MSGLRQSIMDQEQPKTFRNGVRFTIAGEPTSKSNGRLFVRPGLLIKSKKALAYVQSFALQVPKLQHPMTGPVGIEVTIWYASRRPDLDPSLIYDCLQGKIIVNDRQIHEQHIYRRLDKANPRSEIWVYPLG